MFCPKCGGESIEGHKFCKSCGANLQLVSDALSGGDDTLGQLRADMENLKRSLVESGRSVGRAARKEWRRAAYQARMQGWGGVYTPWTPRGSTEDQSSSTKDTTLYDTYGAMPTAYYDKQQPKPKECLRYSRQHNIKEGLLSLLGGGAMGAVFYYLGHIAIDSGAVRDLEARGNIHGLEPVVAMIWLIAAIPVLKGIGQILYGSIFAESIARLSERFRPTIVQLPQTPQQTAALAGPPEGRVSDSQPRAATTQEQAGAFAPPSVTEQTTNILGEMRRGDTR